MGASLMHVRFFVPFLLYVDTSAQRVLHRVQVRLSAVQQLRGLRGATELYQRLALQKRGTLIVDAPSPNMSPSTQLPAGDDSLLDSVSGACWSLLVNILLNSQGCYYNAHFSRPCALRGSIFSRCGVAAPL